MKKIIKSILIKVSRKILSKKIIAFIENSLNIKLFILSSPNEVKNVLKSPVPHLRIFPLATYVPWKIDKNFKKTFNIAKDFTLVDEFRMYELRHLALQACHLKGDFLEVGVWRGGSSAIIQAALTERKSKNNFYIADTFEGVVKAGTKSDTFYKGGEHSDASLNDVNRLYEKLKLKKPQVLIGVFPDDHPQLDIKKLAFVHSDVDAYESTKGVIEWSIPRLVSGGIIVFDDYGFRGCEGVTSYVNNKLLLNKSIIENFFYIYNLNGHAILIKK